MTSQPFNPFSLPTCVSESPHCLSGSMTKRRLIHSLSLGAAWLLSPGGLSAASGQMSGRADDALAWNEVMLSAIVAGTLGNPQAQRMAATVNTAMFDAGNGVTRKYTPIYVAETAPADTHARAAVVQAAYATLKAFYPAQLTLLDKHRASSLGELSHDGTAKVRRGIEWGEGCKPSLGVAREGWVQQQGAAV
jgi:hypothetical protein